MIFLLLDFSIVNAEIVAVTLIWMVLVKDLSIGLMRAMILSVQSTILPSQLLFAKEMILIIINSYNVASQSFN